MKVSVAGGVIGVLVVVNAAAFVAVDQHFQVSADASPASSTTVNGADTPAPSSHTNSSGVSAPAAPVSAGSIPSPGVFAIATNANHAWRAVNSGGCDGSVTVQATQDGGRTWSALAKPPAGTADAIGIDGTGHLQLSGQASDGCAQKSWSLSSGGSWYASDAAAWAPKGATSSAVIHARKQLDACDSGSVIDLATAGDAAYVLCSDGAVRSVPADGTAETVYQGTGLISIGTAGDNTLLVARSVKDCDGVQLAKIADDSAHSITCVAGASNAVDLTFAGDHGWLVAAHNTWTGGTSGDWSKS